MRVLINTLCAVGNRAGVGHYANELTQCLTALAPGSVAEYPYGLSGAAQRAWVGQWLAYAGRAERPGRLASVGAFVRRKALGLACRAGRLLLPDPLRRAVRRGGFTLYHEPNFIPLECDIPTVASVHDLSVLLHPEWHPAARVEEFGRLFHAGLSRCAHLFAISEFGRRQIVEQLGFSADRVSVTYMGVRQGLRRVEGDLLRRDLSELGLGEGYLLHVGTLEPRKNVLMLLKAYCSLPAATRERHPLVLVGGKGWGSDETHAYLAEEGRRSNVRWLGYVNDRHFPSLYSGAQALLFPTLYEGFGMPAVEMMACGGAVLASTAGAVAETAGGQAHLIDPADAGGWRDAMARVCGDEDWRRQLQNGSEAHATRFTWRRCAEQTLAGYRRNAA